MPAEYYVSWRSPILDRDMELLVYGERGAPTIVFPTSGSRFYEWKDLKMVDALADKIDAGFIQLFLADSISLESWYNDQIHPRERVLRHNRWEMYLINELLPFVRSRNQNPYVITAGTSFGAFLAVNFALKHPDLVRKTVGLSGSYSIKRLLDGYYDEDCYFNCPISYMANLGDERQLGLMRSMEIFLVTSDWDIGQCRERTCEMSRVLSQRGIPHRFYEWGGHTGHDWPFWRRMIREYL